MTKRTRRMLQFGLLAGMTVAVSLGVWLLWPRTAITRENAAKIRPGMTLAEAETILGGPMRDESTGTLEDDSPAMVVGRLLIWKWTPSQAKGGGINEWRSDYVSISVVLDPDGRILECHSVPVRRAPEGPIGMIRGWLHL